MPIAQSIRDSSNISTVTEEKLLVSICQTEFSRKLTLLITWRYQIICTSYAWICYCMSPGTIYSKYNMFVRHHGGCWNAGRYNNFEVQVEEGSHYLETAQEVDCLLLLQHEAIKQIRASKGSSLS